MGRACLVDTLGLTVGVFLMLVTKSCLLFQEEPDTILAIQEALSMMVGAYTSLEGAPRTLMEALVASNLIKVCQ